MCALQLFELHHSICGDGFTHLQPKDPTRYISIIAAEEECTAPRAACWWDGRADQNKP